MAQEETILLHFDIDEAPAVNSIRDLRQANTQLRKERDAVNLSTKEGQELVQKLNTTIDKNNKLIKDNSSALEKQRQNVGNYSKSIQEAAGELNIMGTNVGALSTKLTSFINPATAAVGIVTALGAAYARSTIGAKDLEFASNQLGAATTLLTNEFASLFSSAEDGEGAFSRLTNFLIESFSPALAATSRGIALAQEQLEDSQRNEIILRQETNARLEENQELMTKLQDSQVDINEKTNAVTQIISNLRKNEEEILKVKNDQLSALQKQLQSNKEDEKLKDQVAIKLGEISAFERDTERKVQSILKLESNLLDTENKKLDTIQKQNSEKANATAFAQSEIDREKRIRDLDKSLEQENTDPFGVRDFATQQIKLSGDTAEAIRKNEEKNREQYQKSADLKKAIQDAELQTTINFLEATSTLAATAFGEQSALYKIAATTQTLIATYSSATKSYDALAGIPIVGPALGASAAAVAIANGLANVAQINGIAAAGGADFVTTKPTMLIVGDNPGGRERVTVEPLSGKGKTRTFGNGLGVAMAGGGSMTFDPSARDGGFVANQNMSMMNQSMLIANSLKYLPPLVVGVKQITEGINAVQVKENVSTLRGRRS